MLDRRPSAFSFLLLAFALVLTSPAAADSRSKRDFDARDRFGAGPRLEIDAGQQAGIDAFRGSGSELVAEIDGRTGATRRLLRRGGSLTGAQAGDPTLLAREFIDTHATALGLTAADVGDAELTDSVYSANTGVTHVYLRQRHGGIPVYNGQLHLNVAADGRVLSVNNQFLPHLRDGAGSTTPTLDAPEAVARALEHAGRDSGTPAQVVGREQDERRTTTMNHGSSRDPVVARLVWVPVRRGRAELAWNFQIRTLDDRHWWDFNVDAHSGRVWTRGDWIDEGGDEYRVVPTPFESPDVLPTPPPDDGRTVEVDPADVTGGSPFGWHDTDGAPGEEFTITRGNNVNAYEDSNGTNSPSTPQPDCGGGISCDFDFPIDFGTQEPNTYQDAAVTNLFYWNNLIHDIQYLYGFDEPAGNFQVNNYGNGGVGGDEVQAEAQDPGNCNANMATPPDGSPPRMQMFTCNNTSPARDGDFDNLVIVHEYGHGISNRLVGGPSNVGCLNNTQQGGEGYSDWWGLWHTMEVGDAGSDARGVGTYLFGQAPNGPGIRDLPYSTDDAINNWTYESINGASVPHGVGSRWAQAYWEVTWALVDAHGFDPDFYAGSGGNNRALLYFNEGLKNSICSPAFTDVRDGIIQAAENEFGGEDVCTLWEAFAAFGLGTDAVSGGPNSTNPTNGFEIPVECLCDPGQTIPIADAGDDQTICAGGSALIGTPALPGHTYSWSPGGQTTAQISVNPSVTTTYTVTVTTDCGMKSDDVTVFVDPGNGGGLSEDFEGDISDWTFDGLWHAAVDSTCPAPEPGYSSPLTAMYYGQDGSCDYDTGVPNFGVLTSPPIFGIDGASELNFQYLREVESFNGSFDVTQVDVIQGGAATTVWVRDSSDPSNPVWTPSGAIDLSSFAGAPLQLRFRFATGDATANNFLGWLVDDVTVNGASLCGDAIFADGFESGDTSAWSTTVP